MDRRSLLTGLSAFGASPLVSYAFADSYPSKPIRVIVPSSAGGAHDIIARLWADKVKAFGTFVIENRGGAGTMLGASEVARASPDGYMVLVGSTNTHVIQPLVSKQVNYNPLTDFSPVTVLARTSTAVAINPGLPVQTLDELIAYARANPGKLALGHSGPGTNTFLSGEMFKQLGGNLNIISVPYKGAGPSFADLLSGQIQLIVVNVTSQVIDYHKAGKIRLLCINSPARLPALPNAPTSAEAGLPDMRSETFYATFAPAKTPLDILEKLDAATQSGLLETAFQEKMTLSGFEPILRVGPKGAMSYIKAEYDRWAPLVARINTEH